MALGRLVGVGSGSNMDRLAVATEAQDALVRCLAKLDLVDSVDTLGKYSGHEICPIAFYAGKGYFKEWDGLLRVAKELEIPAVRIERENISKYRQVLENELLSQINVGRWSALRAAPIAVTDQDVTVLMANPLDFSARSSFEFEFGKPVQVALGREDEILALLSSKHDSNFIFDLDLLFSGESEKTLEGQNSSTETVITEKEESVMHDIDAAPVVKLVNKIISNAVHNGASDIHISPDRDQLVVRIRVDGIMRPLLMVPKKVRSSVVARLKVLAGMDLSERRKPQDGRMRIKTGLGVKDLRISSVPSMYGENVVIRILSSDIAGVSFESLGIPVAVQGPLIKALGGSSKMVLVAGPTGSGKTSTLYAGLLDLSDGRRNIITVEDPIEYRVPGITQIQVNAKVGMGFPEGLRSILRQDPDVVMVGEIRDAETADIAVQAAQTGHLVLSTIHTNSAPAAITRLLDLGIPSYLIVSSVGAVLAQRLVRKLCTKCEAPASSTIIERLLRLGVEPQSPRMAVGCEACGYTGYQGRTGIYSLLNVDEEIREVIRQGGGEHELVQAARVQDFQTLENYGLALVSRGVTSLDELERVLGPLSSQNEPKQPLTASLPEVGAGLRKRRVLLVEDDEDTRLMLATILSREPFDIDEAENGLDGLDRVYKQVPDLIVCDLMMPRMGGLEFVKRLRRDSRTAKLPILMLTAVDTEDNELELMSCGADDFVSKTSRAEILIARMHALLGRATQVQQAS